jgi:transcriptional activator of cad operon
MTMTEPMQPSPPIIRIGLVMLDPLSRTLCREALQLRIEPKIFDVLWLMLHSPNQQVSREQLIHGIWQQRVVSDSVIHRVFSQLRKQFASLDDSQEYIQTIAKVGYRLVAKIERITPHLDTEHLIAPVTGPDILAPAHSESAAVASFQQTESTAHLAISHAGIESGGSRYWQYPMLSMGIAMACVFAAGYWLMASTASSTDVAPAPLTQQYPLTSHQGSETQVSTDSSGQVQLYLQYTQSDNAVLWRHQAGQHQQLLSDLPGLRFAMLSPDGRQAVLVTHSELPTASCQVLLATLDTTPIGLKPLLNCPTDSHFRMQWRADSRGFYFRQRLDKTQPYSTFYMDAAAGQPQQISLPVAYVTNGDLAAAPSPDHQQLAIAHYKTVTQTELQFWRVSGYQRQQTHQVDLAVRQLHWLDADHLLLVTDKKVYSYHIPTQTHHLVLAEKDYINSLAVSQSRWFVGVSEQNTDILRVALPQSCAAGARQTAFDAAKPIVQSSKIDVLPRISPDGRSLAFFSDRTGGFSMWLKPLAADGQDLMASEAALTSSSAVQHFLRFSWAPDSEQIVYSQGDALYLQRIGHSAPEMLLPASAKAHSANWAADGRSVIFGSTQSGDWQLWQYQPANRQLQQLTTDGGYSGYLLGDRLIYSKFNQPGLYQKKLGSAEEDLLLADFSVINWLNWQIVGDELYYFKAGLGVMRYHMVSGRQDCVFPESPSFVHQYSVQGSQLYFVNAQPAQGDIYWLVPPLN